VAEASNVPPVEVVGALGFGSDDGAAVAPESNTGALEDTNGVDVLASEGADGVWLGAVRLAASSARGLFDLYLMRELYLGFHG